MFLITNVLFLSLLVIPELSCLNQYENYNKFDLLNLLLKPQNKVTAKIYVLKNLGQGKGFRVTLDDEISLDADRGGSNDLTDITDIIDKSVFFRNNNELSEVESEDELKNSADVQTTETKDPSDDDNVNKVPLRGSGRRARCFGACKEVYWEVCHYFSCDKTTRRKVRRGCQRACRKRF